MCAGYEGEKERERRVHREISTRDRLLVVQYERGGLERSGKRCSGEKGRRGARSGQVPRGGCRPCTILPLRIFLMAFANLIAVSKIVTRVGQSYLLLPLIAFRPRLNPTSPKDRKIAEMRERRGSASCEGRARWNDGASVEGRGRKMVFRARASDIVSPKGAAPPRIALQRWVLQDDLLLIER